MFLQRSPTMTSVGTISFTTKSQVSTYSASHSSPLSWENQPTDYKETGGWTAPRPLSYIVYPMVVTQYTFVVIFSCYLLSQTRLYNPCRRHQMETFSASLDLCVGNSSVTGEYPSKRPVTWSFGVFYLRLNKRLSKQSRHGWFETPSNSLWRQCNTLSMPWHLFCTSSTIMTQAYPW